jgi:hypothetical protein
MNINILKFNFAASLFIIALIGIVFLPIYEQIYHYQFFQKNILALFIFLVLIKEIFFTKYSLYSQSNFTKVVLLFLMIPLFLFLLDNLFDLNRFLDEEGYSKLIENSQLNQMQLLNLGQYIRIEYLIALVGGMIATIAFPIKLLISIWVKINKRKNV